MKMIRRRRVLSIIAGLAALPTLPLLGTKAFASVRNWQGISLGANAQIILDHPNADTLILQALAEINRLEKIFSLFDANSQLSLLNKQGQLKDPAFELVELLSISSTINDRTKGAFDPSIQPLWALYANRYANGLAPQENEIAKIKELTGWKNVRFSANQISFKKQGMALSLNGIAQGYIADKITELFKRNGISNVLINTGEISALGKSPQDQDWQIKIANSEKSVELNNMAIATSASLGTVFDKQGQVGHIINPISGEPTGQQKQISVIAKSAAIADGLSTGFLLMSRDEIIAAKGIEKIIFS